MRVLMLSWDAPPISVSAVGAHVDGLSQALVRSGHEVTIVTVAADDSIFGVEDQILHGVRIIRVAVQTPVLSSPGSNNATIPNADLIAQTASANHHLVAMLAHLGSWKPDVIHAHDWRTAWAAHTLSTILGVPLVVTFHSTEQGRHGGVVPVGMPASINAIEWWLALRANRVICCSRFMKRETIVGFELAPDRVHLVPNGVAVEKWSPPHQPIPRQPLVLAWGRVQYEKGFQVLAQAVSRLRGAVPGIHCVIAGGGPYLPELQSQVDIEGVNDLVHLAGYVTDDELHSLVHRAGCVVIPSLYEPFGIVALESMAGGAPTVVARTGGLAEIVEGTRAGLLFEPGNAVELAEQIEKVLTEPAVTRELQTQAHNVLQSHYSWEAIAKATATVYSQVSTETSSR